MKEILYPIRINKFLAYKEYGTRREADALIEKGHVFLNGKKAVLGDIVHENDRVEVKRKGQKQYVYLAYHKPKHIVTHSPAEGEEDIETKLARSDVFPVGRLDKASEGLIILTNDGRVTERLLHPDSGHEKEYIVGADKPFSAGSLKKLERGVQIEGYTTKPAKVKQLSPKKITIILTEGKKHQIRRMLASVGYTTLSLKRIRIGNIKLGTLKPNESRPIENDELVLFLKRLQLIR